MKNRIMCILLVQIKIGMNCITIDIFTLSYNWNINRLLYITKITLLIIIILKIINFNNNNINVIIIIIINDINK